MRKVLTRKVLTILVLEALKLKKYGLEWSLQPTAGVRDRVIRLGLHF